ncbi:folate-binding protein YgfZ [Myxosarcina sp. GI1]|uniref:CAF17-like 4Fe-4S cluster assembly/insertion protein YgfZ n=1 Tax=Myxosarcina sp. GI1 TaxID=1541065 RepID=UPI00056AAE94|nr:folate-binding protein YgfZ [Myxosarcina sp. GI1]
MKKLRQLQQELGAILDDTNSVPLSFNNDRQALSAIEDRVILCDRSHWGVLKVGGEDRLRYLHNQSTNDFASLQAGQGCDTVFVTSTARTLDLATALITEDDVLILVAPNRRRQLLEWLDRFIFPFDKVELSDVSTEYAVFSLIGNKSSAFLAQLDLDSLEGHSNGNHKLLSIDSVAVRTAVGSGLVTPGYTLFVPSEGAAKIWSKLMTLGVIPAGERVWETLRIQQGRPTPDLELTEDYNPLEAGLWQTISFDKGCYIGQETIARLNTYKGVKQKLWGIELSQAVKPGTPLSIENSKIGVLTSCTDTPNGVRGLAYVRSVAGGEGLQVKVGEAIGKLVAVPFLRHE